MQINFNSKKSEAQPLDQKSIQSQAPLPPENQNGGISQSSPEEIAREHDGSHFDDLLSGGAGDEPSSGPAPNTLSREDYHRLICGVLKTASIFTGFKSLDIDENDERNRNGTGAIYDTISEIPALRFMLSPTGKWMDRTMSIALFVMPIAQGCAMEAKARSGGTPGPVYQDPTAPASEGAPNAEQRAILNRMN